MGRVTRRTLGVGIPPVIDGPDVGAATLNGLPPTTLTELRRAWANPPNRANKPMVNSPTNAIPNPRRVHTE
jgi:hypothetical protein